MFQVLSLFSFVIGMSSLIGAPSGDVVRENGYLSDGAGRYEYAAKDGENFIGRLRYRLRMMTCRLQQTSTDAKLQYCYCPSCHVNISTIVSILPEICKPDSMYDISRCQGIYNTDVTRRQAEKTQKKKQQNMY